MADRDPALDDVDDVSRRVHDRIGPLLERLGFVEPSGALGQRGGSGQRTRREVSVIYCGGGPDFHERVSSLAPRWTEENPLFPPRCVDLALAIDRDTGEVSVTWDGPGLPTPTGRELSISDPPYQDLEAALADVTAAFRRFLGDH